MGKRRWVTKDAGRSQGEGGKRKGTGIKERETCQWKPRAQHPSEKLQRRAQQESAKEKPRKCRAALRVAVSEGWEASFQGGAFASSFTGPRTPS